MIIGTSLEILSCMNIEAAETITDDKVIGMPSYSITSDAKLKEDLSVLARDVRSTEGNSDDAKKNLESRRVKFYERYFSEYHRRGHECFDQWNVKSQYIGEIETFLGYTKKQIPQMVKFFSPLFDNVRSSMKNSLGLSITGHSEKLWKRSEALADEYDAEVENVFKDGIFNLSLFIQNGKIKDEGWMEIASSWNDDYWTVPNFKELKALKGKSVSRTLVDEYMIKTDSHRAKEYEAMIKSEESAAKNAFGLLSIQEKFDAIVFPVGPDGILSSSLVELVQNRFGRIIIDNLDIKDIPKKVLANLDVDNRIQIISEINLEEIDEDGIRNLKKELSSVLGNAEKRLIEIESNRKMERIAKMLAKLDDAKVEELMNNLESDLTSEQSDALKDV